MRSVNHLIEQFTDRKSNLRSVNCSIKRFTDRISYLEKSTSTSTKNKFEIFREVA